MPIEALIQELINAAELSDLSLELTTNIDSLPNSEIYKLYEICADQKTKNEFEKSIQIIHQKLEKLPQYKKDHASKPRLIERFEEHITASIQKLIYGIKNYVQESLSTKLTTVQPEWLMPMHFDGVKTITDNFSDYEFCTGKTTGTKIIKQTKWQHRKLAADIGFMIAVVNCSVNNIEDRRVSEETLRNSSSGDLEVFDSIHELERIYQKTPLGLGIIQINQDDLQIISDHDLSSLILQHIGEQEGASSSLSLYIISESYNLAQHNKTSVADILALVPFTQLKELGIHEVVVDFISCNTAEIAAELIMYAERIAKDYDLGITMSFNNGYIFNNITYCYADSNPESTALHDIGDPSKTILQVMHPGFSSVFAADAEDLEKYTSTRKIRTELSAEVTKELLRPDAIKSITAGTTWKYETKVKLLEAIPSNNPSNTLQKSSATKMTPNINELS